MVQNAVKWAKTNGLCRVNAVHGAEEYRVSTFEAFSHKEINRTRSTASAEVSLEDQLSQPHAAVFYVRSRPCDVSAVCRMLRGFSRILPWI